MAKKTSTSDESVMDPEGVSVLMGTKSYVIRELPIARIKKFKTVFLDMFGEVSALLQSGDLSNSNVAEALFGILEDKPAELLSIIIPGFDVELLDDEENGVTIPQLVKAVDTSITENGLDVLRRAVPFLVSVSQNALKLRILQAAIPVDMVSD